MQLSTYLKENKPLYTRKGSFTTAYIYPDRVLLKSRDAVKECMANGWFPDSEHLPEVKYSNLEVPDSFEGSIYESPRYLTSRSIKSIVCKEDYEGIYLPLVKLFSESPWCWLKHGERQDAFYKAVTDTTIPEELKDVLKECYDALLNYDSQVGFEISPRNVGATEEGRLILLDCFYLVAHLKRK